MKKGLVSILMPVYNGMPDIKFSLASLMWQTYTNWECIIVNDGSKDGTREYLDGLNDSRIRVIHLEKNAGRGNARQMALEHVEGEFVAYLDADDWCAPDKIEKQVYFLHQHSNVDLVSTGILSFGKRVNFYRVRGIGNEKIIPYSKGYDMPIACPTVMIRRKAIADHRYNITMDYGEDIDFFFRCMNGRKYAILNEVLYYYSEFDSMSIAKLKKAYKEIYSREKTFKVYLKYLYYSYLAPLFGIDFIIKHRGAISTDEQNRTYEELFKRLKYKM